MQQATVSRELSTCAWVRIPGYPGALCLTDAALRAIAPSQALRGRMSSNDASLGLLKGQGERRWKETTEYRHQIYAIVGT